MLSLLAAVAMLPGSPIPANEKFVRFDDLYPRIPWSGKSARGVSWSHDSRYLAYIWNPYDEPYADLWVFDTKEGKPLRLTSIEVMKQFDKSLAKATLRYQEDLKERAKILAMSDSEYRQYRQERREKQEQEQRDPAKRRASYSGIAEVAWAKGHDELLMVYKGDIFRWKLGDKAPTRITKTDEQEGGVRYTRDDSGFYFWRAGQLYRMRFDSPEIRQLIPSLPDGMGVAGYYLSPDESKIAVVGSKDNPSRRQVDYITYRERFAKAMKTPRDVADDPFTNEWRYYTIDLKAAETDEEVKPYEIARYSGGDDLLLASVNEEPWSADSSKFVFSIFSRNTKDLEIKVADPVGRKVETIYKGKEDGEPNTGSMTRPFFLPDGRVVALLEASGFRNAWIIDPRLQSASQLTRGEYETFPLKASADGKYLWVRSLKESPARMMLYRVPVATGELERVSSQIGTYTDPEISEKGDKIAFRFSSWEKRGETYVKDLRPGADEKAITSSHRPGFEEKVNKLKPQLFSFKNRHGQTVHGFVFLPPDRKPGEKRKLMVYVYGGPLGEGHSVTDGAFQSTSYLFSQYLALEKGVICMTIDPRGQSGYGALFGKANFEQPGKPQVEDLTDAVKHIDETYGVDRKYVGITGWSFGGFQTQMCMYTAPDVFTLGMAGAGPTEWQNYNNWYTGNTIARTPRDKADVTDAYSLTKLAKNLRNPLLLLHGMEDTNVLFQDTVKVYQQLMRYGKQDLVELVVDPTGGHGLGGDIDNHDTHLIYLSFLQRRWGI